MYTKVIPHKNFRGKPRNQEVNFNLTEHEFFKLLVEFKTIFDWQERIEKDPDGETDPREVVDFYNNLEEILLSAWGQLDESGDHFHKVERYKFAESSLFHACMKRFVEDPREANELLDGLMPPGLKEMIQNADKNTLALINDPKTPAEMAAELERLRARTAELEAESSTS